MVHASGMYSINASNGDNDHCNMANVQVNVRFVANSQVGQNLVHNEHTDEIPRCIGVAVGRTVQPPSTQLTTWSLHTVIFTIILPTTKIL